MSQPYGIGCRCLLLHLEMAVWQTLHQLWSIVLKQIRVSARGLTCWCLGFARAQKLAGMTGTAKTEAQEFSQIYKLEVAVVPTNVPTKRVDNADVVFGKEAGASLPEPDLVPTHCYSNTSLAGPKASGARQCSGSWSCLGNCSRFGPGGLILRHVCRCRSITADRLGP